MNKIKEIENALRKKEDFKFTEGIHFFKVTFNKKNNKYQLLQKVEGEYSFVCCSEKDLDEFLFLIND